MRPAISGISRTVVRFPTRVIAAAHAPRSGLFPQPVPGARGRAPSPQSRGSDNDAFSRPAPMFRPPPPPRLLAVAYGGGHIQMVLPVLRALRAQRPGLHIDLLALTTAAKVARAAGESPLGYRDLLPLFDAAERQRALDIGQALLAANTHPDVAPDESLAYLGLNAWALEQQLGPEAAAQTLRESGRQAFYPLTVMRRLIDHLRPALVLATNSPRSEQAALDAAADAGLPTVALLDLFARPGDAFAARTRRPMLTCVLSPAVRDNLLAAGWDAGAIAVTGNPAFDDLLAPAARAAGAALRTRWGGEAVRAVLLALQPEPLAHPAAPGARGDPQLPQRIVAAALAAVAPHPDWRLIVRPHPSQPTPELPADPRWSISLPSAPLAPLLHAVDAVVTGTSTVALQAHLTGAPVLQLLDSIAAAAMPYRALGVADLDGRAADLPALLPRLLALPRRTVNEAAGAAADRVAAAVLGLLPRP